jgi:hypothetical protein
VRYLLVLDWLPNLCDGITGNLHRGLIESDSIIPALGMEGPREGGQRGIVAGMDGYMW